jgi:hypothetical protein
MITMPPQFIIYCVPYSKYHVNDFLGTLRSISLFELYLLYKFVSKNFYECGGEIMQYLFRATDMAGHILVTSLAAHSCSILYFSTGAEAFFVIKTAFSRP